MCWKSYCNKLCWAGCNLAFASGLICAQQVPTPPEQKSSDTLARILDRLEVLEKQNQNLLAEIQSLKEELKTVRPTSSAPESNLAGQQSNASPPPGNLEDRMAVAEQRIKEQAQTKVESSQRFPIKLTGTLLFDAFLNAGPNAYEAASGYGSGNALGGATLRQTILGLDFRGPLLPGGGQVHGFLSMDFFGQAANYDVFRIRRGTLSFDWKRRSVVVGQDKSLIVPLQPASFARVGIPPLNGAGNLWLWRPQVRYEERLPLTTKTRVALQAGLLETDETYSPPSLPTNVVIEPARPAFQTRFEISHQWTDQSHIAGGIGFHTSSTHVFGQSLASRVTSADILFKPFSMLELSGTIFHGENFANIGGGPPGISIAKQSIAVPIRGTAGWLQVALPLTSRLTFDFYAGRLLNNSKDLHNPYDVARTLTYAGNILYQLGPNVVLGFEASQERLKYLYVRPFLANRYDATVAYLF